MATGSSTRSEQEWRPLLASPPTSFALDTQPQDQSPLFSMLPAELRLLIFEYALTDYESTDYFYLYDDPSSHRNHEARRDYRPRRTTDTQLLRTCQRMYCEVWLMPFTLAEHIFYVFQPHPATNDDTRDGARYTVSHKRMKKYVQTLKEHANSHDETLYIPNIQRIRIYFHQACMEKGIKFLSQAINNIPEEFSPKCVTFSLNYKNSWMKSAFGYDLCGKWVNKIRLPNSVTCVRMELGKFSDSHSQIREIVAEVGSKWFFRRQDGMVFRVVANEVSLRRWVANEALSEQAMRINRVYVIPMLTWRLADGFDPFVGGYKCPDLDLTSLALQMDRMPLGDITSAINRLSGTT